MKGNKTAEAMRLVVIACCVRLVGSGARAEKRRMVEFVKLDLMTVARAILRVNLVDGAESSREMQRCARLRKCSLVKRGPLLVGIGLTHEFRGVSASQQGGQSW